MKTAKIASVVRIYALDCPYCGGPVANTSGSLDFHPGEMNGTTGTCTVCDKDVKLPKSVADGAA